MLANIILSILLIILCVLAIAYLKKFVNHRYLRIFFNYLIPLLVLLLIATIVIYPSQSVEAAYNGLIIWATLVIPALMPFFIGSELLINLGLVRFIGLMLEPIMKPIFNVPGEGSFAFAMSITSGYPVGARIVARLKLDNIITEVEGQRLISFCSTSGPLFMMGAVSVGMFKSSKLGVFIAACHYLASILVGIAFSFYKKARTEYRAGGNEGPRLRQAIFQINSSKNLYFGKILADAVKNSFNSLLMIGGFIILFAVIIRMLELLGLISLITYLLTKLVPFKISPAVVSSLITGLLEVTTGSKLVVDNMGMNLASKLSMVSFIIGWSGLSIHAQVASIIIDTGIKYKLYLFSKLLHGLLSSLLAYILFPIFNKYFVLSLSVYSSYRGMGFYKKFLLNCRLSLELFFSIIICLVSLSLLTNFLSGIIHFLRGRSKNHH